MCRKMIMTALFGVTSALIKIDIGHHIISGLILNL